MKKLIFAIALTAIFSCQKETCYKCTTTYTTTTTGGSYASNVETSSITNCSMTRSDADKYEKEMSATATTTIGTSVITTVGKATCREQ